MRRVAIAIAGALVASCALAGCDGIFGIDVFPPGPESDGSSADSSMPPESGLDAPQDASPEDVTTADVRTPPADGPADGAPDTSIADATADATGDASIDATDDRVLHPCASQCASSDTRCVGGLLQTCENHAGCFVWGTPAACPGSSACWGVDDHAYCCAGGTDVCAPSCQGFTADAGVREGCGPAASESCCTSLPVDGGMFLRSYDGVTSADSTNPATVSSFVLDKFEVTVNRFRNFVTAWANGFRPQPGSGVHTHLNGGKGLADSSSPGNYEPGWNPVWAQSMPSQLTDWNSRLNCGGASSTWTSSPGFNEGVPINCVDWPSAYAFCIWDGGFLPSEAEWNYAAAGGGDAQGQRVYAWSTPPSSETIDCSYAYYSPCVSAVSPAGLLTKGYGRWGQADLTGNLWEWNLDGYANYVNPCVDCAYMADNGQRAIRGASYNYPADQLYVAARVGDAFDVLYPDDGFRCARAP